ncbi:MAG: hypothetical protein RR135_04465 [Oscillospiraceae bacterium]
MDDSGICSDLHHALLWVFRHLVCRQTDVGLMPGEAGVWCVAGEGKHCVAYPTQISAWIGIGHSSWMPVLHKLEWTIPKTGRTKEAMRI